MSLKEIALRTVWAFVIALVTEFVIADPPLDWRVLFMPSLFAVSFFAGAFATHLSFMKAIDNINAYHRRGQIQEEWDRFTKGDKR